MPNEYVLRSRDEEELHRLGLQHEVWREVTDGALATGGFRAGDRILDVGSGPGFLTFDLAEAIGPEGSVVAIDSSERFAASLRQEIERRGLHWVDTVLGDARDLELDEVFDGAVCRWVLMFVERPEEVLAAVGRHLRPGGVVVVMEYFQFRSMTLWPAGEHFERVYGAVHRLIASHGGDADFGSRVPELLSKSGFEIESLRPVLRIGRPGSPLWRWLEVTARNHDNLVEAGLLTRAELDAYHEEWQRHAEDPAAFFTAPPVLVTVARKGARGEA